MASSCIGCYGHMSNRLSPAPRWSTYGKETFLDVHSQVLMHEYKSEISPIPERFECSETKDLDQVWTVNPSVWYIQGKNAGGVCGIQFQETCKLD